MAESPRPRGLVRRGVIAVALLVGVYVLVLLVAAAAIAIGVWAVANFRGYGVTKLVVVLAVIVFVLMGAVLRSLRTKRAEPSGIELTPDEQPRLWGAVRQLAAAVGTRPPDEIRLEADVNASVSEESRWLGLRGGRRTMYIGAPLLIGLPVGELCAVLGHELGHYSGRHPAFTRLSWRGLLALRRIVNGMDYAAVRKIFIWYGEFYFRVTQGIRREHEHQADTVAVAVTGRQQTMSMLRRLEPLDLAWQLATEQYAPLAKAAGRSPDLFAAYWALLGEPARAGQYADAVDAAMARPTDRYATHPALGERLAAAAAQPDTRVPVDSTPATSLVAHLPATFRRLQEQILRADLGPPAEWPELVTLAAQHRAADLAGELVRVAAPGHHGVTLGQLLDGVASGHGPAMVRPLVHPGVAPEDRPVAFRTVCTQLLAGCVTSMLIESRLAWARVNWGGPQPWQLVGTDGAVIDVEALVGPAVAAAMPDAGPGSPHGVGLLREKLTGMRVPLDRPIRPVDHDPLAPGLVAVLLNVKLDKIAADLLVCDTGLLFVKQSRWLRPNASQLAIAIRKTNNRRLKKVLAQPLDALRAASENRFIGTHDIVAARFTRKKLTTYLELQLTGGSTARFATTDLSEEIDDAWQRVYGLLGARLQAA